LEYFVSLKEVTMTVICISLTSFWAAVTGQ